MQPVHRLRARLRAILIPWWVFGVAYLACIPLFAAGLIPHGFYQNNIKFEKAYTDQATTIENEVCRSLETHIRGENNKSQEPIKIKVAGYDWWFKPQADMKCGRLRIKDDSIGFTVNVTLQRQQKCPLVISEICFDDYIIPFRVTLDSFAMKIGGSELVSFQPPLGEFAHALSFVVPRLEGFPKNKEMAVVLAKLLFGRPSSH